MGPTVPFEREVREPLTVGQGTAPPRGAVACVSQLWTVPREQGTREDKLKFPFEVEGGALGDEEVAQGNRPQTQKLSRGERREKDWIGC